MKKRQLGLLNGSNIFGDEILVPAHSPYRSAVGTLKSKPRKAIKWYMEEHELTLLAASYWPYITFKVSDGNEQKVHIGLIVDDYENYRSKSQRRRVES